jgi:exodeoxyribonuclease VIII
VSNTQNLTDAEYHAMLDVLSATTIKTGYRQQWELYDQRYVSQTAPTPDLSNNIRVQVGSLVHAILLEQAEPADKITHKPAAAYRELMAAQGKTVLKDEDYHRVVSICNSVMAQPLGDLVMDPNAVFETAVFWTDSATGLKCRCKPDFMFESDDQVTIYDLKVSESASPDQWERVAKNQLYWLQDAHYSSGVAHTTGKPVSFKFWVVEAVAPYRVGCYHYDPISRERAGEAYVRLLAEMNRRYQENDWVSDWTREPTVLTLDAWDVNLPEEELEGFDE